MANEITNIMNVVAHQNLFYKNIEYILFPRHPLVLFDRLSETSFVTYVTEQGELPFTYLDIHPQLTKRHQFTCSRDKRKLLVQCGDITLAPTNKVMLYYKMIRFDDHGKSRFMFTVTKSPSLINPDELENDFSKPKGGAVTETIRSEDVVDAMVVDSKFTPLLYGKGTSIVMSRSLCARYFFYFNLPRSGSMNLKADASKYQTDYYEFVRKVMLEFGQVEGMIINSQERLAPFRHGILAMAAYFIKLWLVKPFDPLKSDFSEEFKSFEKIKMDNTIMMVRHVFNLIWDKLMETHTPIRL